MKALNVISVRVLFSLFSLICWLTFEWIEMTIMLKMRTEYAFLCCSCRFFAMSGHLCIRIAIAIAITSLMLRHAYLAHFMFDNVIWMWKKKLINSDTKINVNYCIVNLDECIWIASPQFVRLIIYEFCTLFLAWPFTIATCTEPHIPSWHICT